MTKKIMLPPKIQVEWLDHGSDDRWIPVNKAREFQLNKCFTVGYLLDEDDERIVVVHTFSPRDELADYDERSWVSDVSVIAKKLILSIKNLEVEKC